MIKIIGDYHIHTKFSDGKSDTDTVIAAAKKTGLKEFALCDHSYRSWFVGMTDDKLEKSKNALSCRHDEQCRALQSIEGNILNFDGEIDVPPDAYKRLDMLSVGFHRFVTRGDGRDRKQFILRNGWTENLPDELSEKNTKAYIKAIEKYPVDVICHIGHRAKVYGKRLFECAKSNGCHIELNEKHIETLEPMLQIAIESGVKFILGSDAHRAENIGRFDRVINAIEKYNVPLDRIVGIDCQLTVRKK